MSLRRFFKHILLCSVYRYVLVQVVEKNVDTKKNRIHVDYAGHFLGKAFLVIADAHSKCPEVPVMKSATSGRTIEAIRTVFGRYGLPTQLVSDNG